MLFQEWEHLFGQVAGYDFDQIPELLEMEREYGIYADGDTARFLFVLHTYYALIIKLLIAEILTLTRYGLGQSFVDHASILDAEGLRSMLQELENGGTFRNLQMKTFSKETFSAGISITGIGDCGSTAWDSYSARENRPEHRCCA